MTAVESNGVAQLARSRAYALFALGFRYPEVETIETFHRGEYGAALGSALAELGFAGAEKRLLPLGKETAAPHAMQCEYVRLFDVGEPQPPCPPYEGLHSGQAERTTTLLEVTTFYAHFGLKMAEKEGSRELADHLCAELEFMHFLALKEYQAEQLRKPDYADGFRLAQHDFLHLHLGRWVGAFATAVDTHGCGFYPALAASLHAFVAWEGQAAVAG